MCKSWCDNCNNQKTELPSYSLSHKLVWILTVSLSHLLPLSLSLHSFRLSQLCKFNEKKKKKTWESCSGMKEKRQRKRNKEQREREKRKKKKKWVCWGLTKPPPHWWLPRHPLLASSAVASSHSLLCKFFVTFTQQQC